MVCGFFGVRLLVAGASGRRTGSGVASIGQGAEHFLGRAEYFVDAEPDEATNPAPCRHR